MPSIQDVALKAGVSDATVSRVINRLPGVSTEKKTLVMEAMKSLSYVPRDPKNRPGRKSGKEYKTFDKKVLLLLCGIGREATIGNIYGDMIRHIEKHLFLNHCEIQLVHAAEMTPQHFAFNASFDGAICIGKIPDTSLSGFLQSKPTVWALGTYDSKKGERWGDQINCDNFAIGRIAADYLISRGHKKLAFINPALPHPDFPERREAFVARAIDLNHSIHLYESPASTYFPPQSLVESNLEECVDRWQKEKNRASGLFCPGDLMTALLYRVLLRRKVLIGKEVEIISCNNEKAYLTGLVPRPPTFDLNIETICRLTVNQILYRMNPHEKHPPEELIRISPHFVLGD